MYLLIFIYLYYYCNVIYFYEVQLRILLENSFIHVTKYNHSYANLENELLTKSNKLLYEINHLKGLMLQLGLNVLHGAYKIFSEDVKKLIQRIT